jgi:hypothetical protein
VGYTFMDDNGHSLEKSLHSSSSSSMVFPSMPLNVVRERLPLFRHYEWIVGNWYLEALKAHRPDAWLRCRSIGMLQPVSLSVQRGRPT